MNIEKVLEEYHNGDENRRLSLFLAYRELRVRFSLIDQESSHDDFTIIRLPWSEKRSLERAA